MRFVFRPSAVRYLLNFSPPNGRWSHDKPSPNAHLKRFEVDVNITFNSTICPLTLILLVALRSWITVSCLFLLNCQNFPSDFFFARRKNEKMEKKILQHFGDEDFIRFWHSKASFIKTVTLYSENGKLNILFVNQSRFFSSFLKALFNKYFLCFILIKVTRDRIYGRPPNVITWTVIFVSLARNMNLDSPAFDMKLDSP